MELATRKLSRTLAISSTTNRVPLISLLSPDNVTAGGAGFTLTVTGSGFVPGVGGAVEWEQPDDDLCEQHRIGGGDFGSGHCPRRHG